MELDSFQRSEFDNHWSGTIASVRGQMFYVDHYNRDNNRIIGTLMLPDGREDTLTDVRSEDFEPLDMPSGFYPGSRDWTVQTFTRLPTQSHKRGINSQNAGILNTTINARMDVVSDFTDFHRRTLLSFYSDHLTPRKISTEAISRIFNSTLSGESRFQLCLGRNYMLHSYSRRTPARMIYRVGLFSLSGLIGNMLDPNTMQLHPKVAYLTPSVEEELSIRFNHKVSINV